MLELVAGAVDVWGILFFESFVTYRYFICDVYKKIIFQGQYLKHLSGIFSFCHSLFLDR